MRDIDDRDRELVAHRLDQRQDFELALMSSAANGSSNRRSCGQESSARPIATRCRSPPDRRAGRALEKMADAERLDDGSKPIWRASRGANQRPKRKVLPHAEMRKEMRVLEDQADAAAMRRHENFVRDIDEDMAVDDDMAAVRAFSARR